MNLDVCEENIIELVFHDGEKFDHTSHLVGGQGLGFKLESYTFNLPVA